MPDTHTPLILDLCAGSGAWSQPYVDSGRYRVARVDLPADIRLLGYEKNLDVRGILAAPPCTVFAASGNRWPRTREDYIEGMSVVDACLRLVLLYDPMWWALENPAGKLVRYLGPPALYFDPCDYGDPYRKKTGLWGEFTAPKRHPAPPVEKSPIHYMGQRKDRAAMRAITPPGFAQAFFEANP